MLTMDKINCITTLHDVYGLNINEIKKETGHHYETITKYLDQKDWNKKTSNRTYESKLDPLKPIIDQWLLDDLDAPRKQRHTSKLVFERLQDEYPEELKVGKRTVERYVKVIKAELRKDRVECALALEHHKGDGQVDFGEVYHRLPGGALEKGYELVVSFPYSNAALSYYCLGQNQECLLEGLKYIFEAIGGVPKRLLFDNLSAAVVKIEKDGQRTLTEQFNRFRAHYGFIAAFCNPAKGNEKGHVENKVGYTRRNFFVPVPQIKDYQTFNAELIKRCLKDMNRPHHNKETMIRQLFEEEKMAFLNLAKTSFKVFRRKVCKTDKYSYVRFENNKYSTHPRLVTQSVTLEYDAWEIRIYDENLNLVCTHKRHYSKVKDPIVNWIDYLPQIAKKPKAIKYSAYMKSLPPIWHAYFNRVDHHEAKEMLDILMPYLVDNELDKATSTFESMTKQGVEDAQSFKALLRHDEFNMPLSPTPQVRLPKQEAYENDMTLYQSLMPHLSGGETC